LPTILNNLTLTGTTTIYDNLDIQANNVSFSTGSYATTSKYGVGQIATIAELDSGLAASTDSALDAAGPNFVTPQGLEHWKVYNRLVSQRTTILVIYVLPNWSSPTVSNPQKTIDQMLLDPPTSVASAVPLASAALYGNTVLSSTETAEYRLSVGVFTEGASFNHNAAVVGGWNFGGASPTQIPFDPVNFNDPSRGSQFIPSVTYALYAVIFNQAQQVNVSPSLNFTKTGSASNIFWPGAIEVLRGTTKYPNSQVTGGAGPRGPAADLDSFLLWCNTNIGTPPSNAISYCIGVGGIEGDNVIVNGVVFGAIDACFSTLPGGFFPPAWITVTGSVKISNTYIRGNVRVSSASGFSNTTLAGNWGNRGRFITFSSESNASVLSLGDYNISTPVGPLNFNYAYVENGINLINNSGAFPVGTGVDAPGANDGDWNLGGPYMFSIINSLYPGNQYSYKVYSLWPGYAVTPNGSMGWYGRFGSNASGSGPTGTFTLNGTSIVYNFQYTTNSPWQGLGTITPAPIPFPATPGGISAPVTWDWLNVELKAATVGIDVNTTTSFTNSGII